MHTSCQLRLWKLSSAAMYIPVHVSEGLHVLVMVIMYYQELLVCTAESWFSPKVDSFSTTACGSNINTTVVTTIMSSVVIKIVTVTCILSWDIYMVFTVQ